MAGFHLRWRSRLRTIVVLAVVFANNTFEIPLHGSRQLERLNIGAFEVIQQRTKDASCWRLISPISTFSTRVAKIRLVQSRRFGFQRWITALEMKGVLAAVATQQLAGFAAGSALIGVFIVLLKWLEQKTQGAITRANEKGLIYSVFVTHIAAGRAALSTRMVHTMPIIGRHTSDR
jgi:hypothetical protein